MRRYYRDELGRFKPAPRLYRGAGGRFREPKVRERRVERMAEAERRRRIDKPHVVKGQGAPPTPPGQDVPRWIAKPIPERGYGWGYRVEVIADVSYRYPMWLRPEQRLELQYWRTIVCNSPEDAERELIALLQRATDMADNRGGFAVERTLLTRYWQDPRGGAYDIVERRVKTPAKRLWIHGKVPF